MINATFDGNLGRDGELKTLNTGSSVLNFSVGVSTGYGERQKTLWIKCAMFGKRAETIAPWMLKGKKVLVAGQLSEDEWTKEGGEISKTLSCNVSDIAMLSPKDENQQQTQQRPVNQQVQQQQQQQPQQNFDSDHIPF